MRGFEQDRLGDAPLIGLDQRPRPRSMRARILRGLSQSAPFSSLQRRIILFNLLGLAFLVLGVLYLSQFRSGLIEQRLEGLGTLAEVMAVTLAEDSASGEGGESMDVPRAVALLGRLVAPTGLRARLYDVDRRLIADSRSLLPAQDRPATRFGAAESEEGLLTRAVVWIEDLYGSALGPGERAGDPLPPERISHEPQIREAATGASTARAQRNALDQIIVSVAHPVGTNGRIAGVLLLSTEGGDIDQVVRAERVAILQVFVLASLVSVVLSILLANTIARPIKKLAAAAAEGGHVNPSRPVGPDRVQIPDMTGRTDEIGELSAALGRMTDALYARIAAIESFASDVAHEIKNPLTSLRSAVETMAYARTPEQRQRLLDVIAQDVSRMDRLVTDISNASRLDAELVRERMELFDLGRLVEGLVQAFADQGARLGVKLELDLPRGPLVAEGLEGRIAQVISNFLDNALSFSPQGGTIRVAVHRIEGALRVAVEDEGPGVPPENLESVFERFYTERPDSQGFGNHSGLGLAISRQIVEAHGGRIWVENRAGADGASGARFCFDLPDPG